MRLTSFATLFSVTTFTLADPFCIEAILSTIKYQPALTAHNGACPTATPGAYSLAPNGAGCCPSDVKIKTVGEGAACCPCGALCTGFFPDMLEWSESGSKYNSAKGGIQSNGCLKTNTTGSTKQY
jgi:hypothetical protein